MTGHVNKNIRLSILVPLYRRYGRLYRGLVYLSEIIKNEKYKNFFDGVEIIIADGTRQGEIEGIQQEARFKLINQINCLNNNIEIELASLPGTGYFERLVWLSKRSQGKYITMLGDEDVLAFDSIEKWLNELDEDCETVAITGQYLDFKGFELLGSKLKFYLEEGWVYGVDINGDCAKSRILQLCLLGSGGISSISYSLMRSCLFEKFASTLEKNYEKYTYVGMETLLNHFQVAAGKIKIKNMPYVLRDFTFIDHSSLNQDWSDAVKDRESLIASLRIVNQIYPLSMSGKDELENYYSYLLELRSLGTPLRHELHRLVQRSAQKKIVEEVRGKICPSTMRALTKAWKSTLRLCYSEDDLQSLASTQQFYPRSIARRIKSKLNFRS